MESIDKRTLGLQIGFALELFKTGKYEESLIQYEYIINNYEFNFPEIFIAYGNCLFALGKLDEAIDSFKKALRINVKLTDASLGLGKAYLHKKEYQKAEKVFSNLVENESSLSAANYLAYTYEKQERYNEAEYLYVTILEINNKLHEVWNGLALFYKNCRKNEEKAIEAHQKAIELDTNINYLRNFALTLLHFDRAKEAIEILKKCLDLDLSNSETYNHLAVAYQKTFQKKLGLENFEKSIELNPENHSAIFNYAIALLSYEDYKKGFELYTKRWDNPEFTDKKRDFSNEKIYKGKKIKDKTLLVYSEQGFGDMIQFIRFLPLLKTQSEAKLIFQCEDNLKKLLASSSSVDKIISMNQNIDFDFHIALMDSVNVLNLDEKNIPNKPYIEFVKNEICLQKNDNIKVGLTWRGKKSHDDDHNRSIDLQLFKNLFELEQIDFYSLQVDEKSLEEIKNYEKLNDTSSLIKDFNDTANIINQLDLVISVDTAIAHLSAGMGKKTWILLPYFSDWRWGIKREDSLWYSSAKLFRQNDDKNWEVVIKKVIESLKNEVGVKS
ncbi:tetratricopeptide repeat protein [Halarcobacter sp.]|uniref:tetratricopeptide repeat protein n=1 Tax=Halarcobacter sp. TaxID=2321133 RepID=UPI002AABF398|nr:tetratricopeptide repeat protein [Halarcobacter sp.]